MLRKTIGIFIILSNYTLLAQSLSPKISFISIPVRISIDDLATKFNQNMGADLYVDNSFDDNNRDQLKAKVKRIGDLKITKLESSKFYYEIPLDVWVQKEISLLGIRQAPQTQFQILVKFSTEIGLQSNYRLKTKTEKQGYSWLIKPVLKISGSEIPISSIIAPALSKVMNDIGKKIDETISKEVNLKPYVLSAWNIAKKPFLVSPEYHTWLQSQPAAIFSSTFSNSGRYLNTSIALKAMINTITSPNTPDYNIDKDIPALQFSDNLPKLFDIQLHSLMEYTEASRLATQQMKGKEMDFKNGKYKIKITSIEVGYHHEALQLKVGMSGNFTGSVIIEGEPFVQESDTTVRLKKAELDLKTKNVLKKGLGWLLEGYLEKQIEKEFSLPLSELLNYTKGNFQKILNSEPGKGLKLKGVVTSLRPESININPEGILSLISIRGHLEIIVQGI